ncbi:MAG: hypothetical protein ACL93V_16195 [Candidatus Electrothrix sp. YB6]
MQTAETYSDENDSEYLSLITHVAVQAAHESDADALMPCPAKPGKKVLHYLRYQEAADVVQDYLDTGVLVLSHKYTQLQKTFTTLLKTFTTRGKMFDVVLAATLKDHEVAGL